MEDRKSEGVAASKGGLDFLIHNTSESNTHT